MVKYIQKMLAFPFTVAKVLKITQSEDSGASDLARAIQADPIITTTILKVANSVLFASRGKRISDIKEAIVRIGFIETKNIAMGLSVMKIFTKNEKNVGFSRIEFWYHSLACGIIAEKLAKNAGYPRPEEAFISGLLHDFGVIIEDEFFRDLFEKVMENTTKNATSFIEEEKALMGIDHNDVMERLFEQWKMPESVIFAVKNQRNYSCLDSKLDPELLILASAIGIAHIVTKSRQIGRECDMFVEPVQNKYLEMMKYPAGLREVFWEEVDAQLNLFNSFLDIDKRKYPLPAGTVRGADQLGVAVYDSQNSVFNPILGYIETQGYKISLVKSEKEIEQLASPVSIIFYFSRKDETVENFRQFLDVVKKTEGKEIDPSNIHYIPLMVFHDRDSVLKNIETIPGMTKFENATDLRNVDLAIECITSGRPLPHDLRLDITSRVITGNITIIGFKGAINIGTLVSFKEGLSQVMYGDVKNFALNFNDVKYIDSSGIRVLINVYKKMAEKKAKFCLLQVPPDVKNVLNVTNLSKIIKIAADEDSLYDVLGIGESLAGSAEQIAVREKPATKEGPAESPVVADGGKEGQDPDDMVNDVVNNL
jgi:anti-anti-sigma factor